MILKIKNLEEVLEKKYEDWEQSTLLEIVESEELMDLFTPEVAAYLVENKTNDKIYDIMLPVKYGYYMREVKALIYAYSQQEANEEITRKVFVFNIMSLTKGKLFSKALAYYTILHLIDEKDLTSNLTDIQEVIDQLLDIINEVKIETAIELIAEIMDIIDPIREAYFEKYKIDIFEYTKLAEKYVSIIERLNKATEPLIANMIHSQDENEGIE